MNMRKYLAVIILFAFTLLLFVLFFSKNAQEHVATDKGPKPDFVKGGFIEKYIYTPNYDQGRVNEVLGVVLHHTAEPNVEKSLEILTSPEKKVSAHVVIDTDGTRYILASPEIVTFHAGFSILNNREGCNYFTIGIEFQGNTLENPLTKKQIESGVEYLLPIIMKYGIPIENVVTHEMVRMAYKQKYPNKKCSGKVDITHEEYTRFMEVLQKAL